MTSSDQPSTATNEGALPGGAPLDPALSGAAPGRQLAALALNRGEALRLAAGATSRRRAALRYIGVRLFVMCLTIWFAVTLLFLLLHATPSDPVAANFAPGASFSKDQWAELRHVYGLDQPLIGQYGAYLTNLLHGNLGSSFYFREDVAGLILGRLPTSLILMLSSLFLGLTVGTFLGVTSARAPNSIWDNVVRSGSMLGYSIPEFWLAILFLLFFASLLGIFPTSGMVDPTIQAGTFGYYLSIAWHAMLPIMALSVYYIGAFARNVRTVVLEQATENYVITARMKGLTKAQTFRRHVLRNALPTIATLLGVNVTYVIGGAIVIETVFSWPGMGLLTYQGIISRDYPLLLGIFLITVVFVVAANLLLDVLYGILDPRVRGDRA
jgi:peptide/nickel transport system permease protein